MRYAIALGVLLAACSDSSGPPALRPASFAVIAGANQIDTVARELKEMVALRVIATDGVTPVPSYPITWSTLDGGSVFVSIVNSGTDGIARQRWTLGTGVGMQRLVARALDPNTGAILVDDTVHATALPGPAVYLWMNPEGTVSRGPGTLTLHYGLWDSYFNDTWACSDPVQWQISGDAGFAQDTVMMSAAVQVDSVMGWRQDFVISGPGASTMRLDPATSCKTNVNYLTVNYQP